MLRKLDATGVKPQQRAGSIINNASTGGFAAGFTPLLYSVAKAAVIHATRWVALELAEYQIRVNASSREGQSLRYLPGHWAWKASASWLRTKSCARGLFQATQWDGAGENDDIAATALFLASDASSLMNGQNLVVDGGTTVSRNYHDAPPLSRTEDHTRNIRDDNAQGRDPRLTGRHRIAAQQKELELMKQQIQNLGATSAIHHPEPPIENGEFGGDPAPQVHPRNLAKLPMVRRPR